MFTAVLDHVTENVGLRVADLADDEVRSALSACSVLAGRIDVLLTNRDGPSANQPPPEPNAADPPTGEQPTVKPPAVRRAHEHPRRDAA